MNRRYGFGTRRAATRSRGAVPATPTPPLYVFTGPGSLPAGAALTRASAGGRYDASGLIAWAANDAARFDYNPSSLAYRGLRMEPANTNVAAWSGTTSNAAWSTTSARLAKISTNNADPGGGNNACLFTGNGSSGVRAAVVTSAGVTTNGTTYTLSIFLKAGTQSLLQLTGGNAGFGATGIGGYANFNLSGAGSIGTATHPATIQALPDGWYRVSLTVPAVADVSSGTNLLAVAAIASLSDGRLPITSLNTSFLAWGACVTTETSLTSYIETNAAAATRAEDILTLDGPAGAWRVTFENDTTQTLSLTASAGNVKIAGSGLSRLWVKSVEYLP